MHVTPLDESQLEGVSYEHFYTPCVPISCDCYNSFDHNADSCPLLGRPHRLEALAALNRELYLYDLFNINLSLGSPTHVVGSCGDFDVRSEAPITLAHNFHDDTHCHDLEEASDLLFPFTVTPSLELSTVSNHPVGSLVVHDSSLCLALLGELDKRDEFETGTTSDD